MSGFIYTVSSMDIPSEAPEDMTVVSAWSTRKAAVRDCVDYIIQRLYLRPDIRYAFMHNEEDGDVLDAVALASYLPECQPNKGSMDDWKLRVLSYFEYYPKSDEWSPPPSVMSAITAYLLTCVSEGRGYSIETDTDSDIGAEKYVFMVSEVPLDAEQKEG